ncbi:MAG: rhomboid family intramembrane serine protease [Victivallales bacterium]|nr:rhomboid family intramembrane serine protease [Victivallales bacterium]
MNITCPRCGQQLAKSFYQGKIGFHCPEGHGRAVTLSTVRSLCGNPAFANALWRKAMESQGEYGGSCPMCNHPMTLVTLQVEGKTLELDVCCRCQELWFDPNELEALPKPPPPKEPELPPQAKEILALHAVKEMKANDLAEPPSGWAYVAGLFGFPIERGAPTLNSVPWVTWLVAAICVIAFIFTWQDLETVVKDYGLIPAECFRNSGATFITSMFLHGGIGHLLGNMYFLLIFGDNVEDALGKPLYFLLIMASGLTAGLLHIAMLPNSTVPCVGASGFISGVIAAYAVFFPDVTISLCLRFFLCFRWFGIPAWFAFVLWMLLQGLMTLMTFHVEAGVAYGAHLGGALFGLAVGFLLRNRVRNHMSAIETKASSAMYGDERKFY